MDGAPIKKKQLFHFQFILHLINFGIGKDGEIGKLSPGRHADITVLRLEDISQDIEDSHGEMRTLKKAFVPVRVFAAGKQFPVVQGTVWANQESVKACRERTSAFMADEMARKNPGN